MAKKKRYNYIKKKTARGTVPCILTMLLSLGLLLTALILSVYFQGQGPMVLGAIALTSMVMALFSLYYLLRALHDPERKYTLARIGGILSGCILLIWIGLLVIGVRTMI
ncbi:MAG TPA: hypothetical protein DD632_07145 [Oribacterium sp.]|nr:hypothetical protein [Oribacterium sp.]HCS67787.1 hypothetical protein [Oribacterium sp.]